MIVLKFQLNPRDEGCRQKALRNGLILQKIFSNIPTKLLVSSCSLVNKTWNTEVRKFIRDNRKCTVVRNTWSISPCKLLEDLDTLCSQIVSKGRIIPFNCLQLHFYKDDNDSISGYRISGSRCPGFLPPYRLNLNLSNMKLKHLELLGGRFIQADCIFHKPLRALLQRRCHELRSLKTDCIGLFQGVYNEAWDWSPHFPQLELLDLGKVFGPKNDESLPAKKEIVDWLLSSAPNLQTIVIGKMSALKTVSEEILVDIQLKLPDSFEIQCENDEEVGLLQIISEKASGLSELHVKSAPRFEFFFWKTNSRSGSRSVHTSLCGAPLSVESPYLFHCPLNSLPLHLTVPCETFSVH